MNNSTIKSIIFMFLRRIATDNNAMPSNNATLNKGKKIFTLNLVIFCQFIISAHCKPSNSCGDRSV